MLDIFMSESPLYIQEFVFNVCDLLNITHYDCDLVLFQEKTLEDNTLGMCSASEERIEITYAMQMDGESIPKKDKLITIAHELVHAKQHLKGELKLNHNYRCVWMGKEYVGFDDEDFMPWENEAYKLEYDIYMKCKR